MPRRADEPACPLGGSPRARSSVRSTSHNSCLDNAWQRPVEVQDALLVSHAHPAVRSSTPGKCPVCTMDLVALRPARIGEYHIDVRVMPSRRGRGLAGLRMALRDPDRETPVRADMVTVHERPLHVFVISRDLEYFAHVHPAQQPDDSFLLEPNAVSWQLRGDRPLPPAKRLSADAAPSHRGVRLKLDRLSHPILRAWRSISQA